MTLEADLKSFTFNLTLVCPVTQQQAVFPGPRRPAYSIEQLAAVPQEERQDPRHPWNQPYAVLQGWQIDIEDAGTTEDGVTAWAHNCPHCRQTHTVDLADAARGEGRS